MFDQPGIGPDDLAWIRRDQYVYYVEMAHALTGVDDWPRLRQALLDALSAAFGADDEPPDSSTPPTEPGSVGALLDHVRARHDPATDWPAFFDALWSQRHHLLADPQPPQDP